MKALIVIPSRYGSSRFEGKPLIDIAGKSLVRRTYEQALKTNLQATVIVATDDRRIYDHVSEFGDCMMTSSAHLSGTDRCFEVAESVGENFDCLINLQGDEPFILPEQIELLAKSFVDSSVEIATLKKPIKSSEELINPNIVKVITGKNKQALYFSRQAIPFLRQVEMKDWPNNFNYFRHIGLYGFSHAVISRLKHLQASLLEEAESLEQLRWLENGYKIIVEETDFVSPAIDSPDDLTTVDNFLKMNPQML